MKTLILYASKYGCAENCAKYLKSKLDHESQVINLKNTLVTRCFKKHIRSIYSQKSQQFNNYKILLGVERERVI